MAAEIAGNAIREALEPFAKAAERVSDRHHDHNRIRSFTAISAGLTVGDLRRARTAYDAIGSGVKAQEDAAAFLLDRLEPFADGLSDASDVTQYHGHVAPAVARLRAILSTHTATGAGPVGEAVAWRVRAYPGHRWQIVETIPHNFPRDWEKEPLHVRPSNEPVEAGESAAFDEWWAGSGRKASYASVLYDQAAWVAWKERASRARPVEEPGEVERLTRERDDMRDRAFAYARKKKEWAEDREAALVRAETAEAALAETRERLENAAQDERNRLLDAAYSSGIRGFLRRQGAVPLQARAARAALTGDAQEVGR